ncbi:prlC [Symbiodinium sp. KB8]|nr:prlC [Symbiodinium sp. KB8]
MIRAPIINTALNAASTLRQVLSGKNAFEEVISARGAQELCLRDVSSAPLWLLACRRARGHAEKAFATGCPTEVATSLARWSELTRFGQALQHVGVLRPALVQRHLTKLAMSWYETAVARGVQSGLLNPAEVRGIPASVLLRASVEDSTSELLTLAQKQQENLQVCLQKGLAGQKHLHMNDEDLRGLTEQMKSVYASDLGSAAVWRRAKYKVPVRAADPGIGGSPSASFAANALVLWEDGARLDDGEGVQTIVVDGNPVKMDRLGPLVINTDGSIARINNWHEMTEHEQTNTLRVLGKRNKMRLAKLQQELHEGASATGDANPVADSTKDMHKISDYCQNASTRQRMFEAYYGGFDTSVDEAALELLRTRRQIAQQLGFRSWADLEMAPLALGDEAGARRFLDLCWKDAQASLAPVHKRIEERNSRDASGSAQRDRKVSQVDEAFWHSHLSRQSDIWKFAEYLPLEKCLPGLLDIVGKVYGVTFREATGSGFFSRLAGGWRTSLKIFEVVDGAPRPAGVKRDPGRGRVGYVYLDLYARRMSMLGQEAVEQPGACTLCPGHAYVSCNMFRPPLGRSKLMNVEEAVALAHELGHAIHMLCHPGSPCDFGDMPLDLVELPSTLVETIVLQPQSLAKYTCHYNSNRPAPESLIRSCQRNQRYFINAMQHASISLGVHAEAFDPFKATPADLRAEAVSLWQRYSLVPADPAFHPFGTDAGVHVSAGGNQVAYLLCYLRVAGILQANNGRKDGDAVWLQPDFPKRIRGQLLDQDFASKGWASRFPAKAGGQLRPHPLPPLPKDTSALLRLEVGSAIESPKPSQFTPHEMAPNAGIVIRYGYSTELHTTQKLASYSRRVFSAMAPSRGPLEEAMKAKLRQMQVARDADLGRLQEQLSANLATVQNRDEELMAAEARLQAWSAEAAQLRTSAQGEAQLRASCERQSAVLRSKLEQASASHSQLETQLRELQTELNEEATAAQRYKDCNSTLEEELKQAQASAAKSAMTCVELEEELLSIRQEEAQTSAACRQQHEASQQYQLEMKQLQEALSSAEHREALLRQNEETAQREKEEQHAHLARLESHVASMPQNSKCCAIQ